MDSGHNANPRLFPHKLSIWPPCGTVLTAGIDDELSLIPCSKQLNYIPSPNMISHYCSALGCCRTECSGIAQPEASANQNVTIDIPHGEKQNKTNNNKTAKNGRQVSLLVGWCFEPSQPQRIISGLKKKKFQSIS